MKHKTQDLLFSLALMLLIAAALLLSLSYLYLFTPANYLPRLPVTELQIPRGATFAAITDSLQSKNLINSRRHFYLTAKAMGKLNSLQAGNFRIHGGSSYFELLTALGNAKPNERKFTVPEGMEYSEIAYHLEKQLNIPARDFLDLKDSVRNFIPEDWGLLNLEGCLYPDTYNVYESIDAETVVKRMTSQFRRILKNNAVPEFADSLGVSVNYLLTMASIIQGEVIFNSEMPTVSAVYWNRIRKRMMLQADPTIQFIIPGPDIRLRHRHLEIESPYNTYRHYGLPPGPINSPGIRAILAACQPGPEDYLYFVATGDGYHTFSRTLAEHNKAKAEFQKVRRRVFYEKRREAGR